MSQRQFDILMNRVGDRLEPKVATNNAIPGRIKLLLTLRFYATNADFSTLLDTQGLKII
jgi:hypothetical protein